MRGGQQSQISGYYDPIPTPESQTGWVYIVADNFDRSQPMVLYRVTPENFGDRSRWQGWASGTDGGWGKPPTPLWGDTIGEISFTQIDGKSVLSYFNSSTGNMEVRVADDPDSLGRCAGHHRRPARRVARTRRKPAAAARQPTGPAVRRIHLAGLDA